VIHDARAIGSDSTFLCLSSSRARPGRLFDFDKSVKAIKEPAFALSHMHRRLLQHQHVLGLGGWISQVMQIWDSEMTAYSASTFDPAYNVM
jgi:hypothetical protein